MFQRMIDDFKESTGITLRLTSLAIAAAFALLVTTCFLCAAAFIFVLDRHGPVYACLTGAAVFLAVTLIAAGSYMVRKHQVEVRAEKAAKAAANSMLLDPAMVAVGIQLARAIGFRRLVPILAIGGVALGFLASRGHTQAEEPAE
ncbi:hypothetical protein [Bradyrhizobium sp.]|uniref:hypothetical protein n=1 Tax=Bradyrhizobium sp. TaxID=376 RepID=UPI001DD8991A|nr:hypothetical protein [Bradyrhizobium sp.]MBI5321517.1 hypothetical protein [Bradyrhizobium sp.]